jgi:MarR family transcriptional regulator, transcriptional regulator for hemolysin
MSRHSRYHSAVQTDAEPIGLEVTRTGRALSIQFNSALAEAGGSLPQWLILTSLKRGTHTMQRDIAAAIGIEGATLTHHLNRMETDGLVRRKRVEGNRRTHVVTLTPAGEALFKRLLGAVIAFDQQLRTGLSDHDLDTIRGLLARLRANAVAPGPP